MAATSSKLKSLIISTESKTLPALYSHVKKCLHKKNLSHRIELMQLQPTENSTLIGDLTKANSDVLLVHSVGIDKIIEPLTLFVCSDKCNCKLIQFTSAGVDNFMKAITKLKQNPPKMDVCRFGGYFGIHMAEYVVGNIISRERNLFKSTEDQKKHEWCPDNYRRLSTLSMGIIGAGDIGKHVAKACKMFGMTIWGVTRGNPREPSPVVDHYRQLDGLKEMMSSCDYICNVLPSTPDTRGLLTQEHFKCCSEKKSVFINVGRGDVTSDDIIVQSIKNGWLGGAILDVFENEPLPTDSPLWDLPQVLITPHTSAYTQSDEAAEMFVNQLERVLDNRPLTYTVDFTTGY